MLILNKQLWSRYKPYAIIFLIFVWLFMFISILIKNPGSQETQEKMAMMKVDMSALMSLGGKIAATKENSKYGSALIYLTLYDEGWSRNLVHKYEEKLIERGWEKTQRPTLSFCKVDVLAEIRPNSGTMNNQGTNSVSMTFDVSTIETCSSQRR